MPSERIQRQIDRLLDEADEAIASQDWTIVGDRARSALRLDPENQDALSYLAAAERDTPPESTQPAIDNIVQQPLPVDVPASGTEVDHSRARLEQYIPRELLTKLEGARNDAASSERRVVTMLFCDVTGSTAAADSLDPEEWAEIMNGAFEYLISPIYRYEGTLARLMGDAILAFFGAPIAHEDDPQRAVLAGLDIVRSIRSYQAEVKGKWNLDFGVRVGINTGLVVVGEVGSDMRVEYTAMGDAINLAARMEQTAQTGTVQISEDTYNLIAPLFECESLDKIEVKGKREPVPAYRVMGAKDIPGRLRGIEGLRAPLVGRDSEMDLLRQVLERLNDGRGSIVCLIGDAGMGKSCILEELQAHWARIAGGDAPWIESRGVSYDTTRPYGMFIQRMLQMFGIEDSDSLEMVREKFAIAPEGFQPEVLPTVVRAAEALLAFRTDSDNPQLEGEALQHEVYNACHSMWRAAASFRPTALVLDDFHWADPASVDLMIDIFSLVDEVPLLLLFSFRPERQSPAWRIKQTAETDYPHLYTEISLRALSVEDSEILFRNLLDVADSPTQLRQMILAKTEGNPFFIEEFIRTLIDTGAVIRDESGMHWRVDTKVEDIPIPENLQALLTARIDRLEDDTRRTLQLSSVIGRSFHHGVLKLISDSSIALDKQLSTLQRVELIREASRVPELEYIFQHDLTREAAYNSILLRERREFHRRVGEAVEEMFNDRLEEQSHLMAHHFYEAGDTQRALKYSIIAGERALSTYAHEEALAHFRQGLDAKGAQPLDSEGAAMCFGLGRAQGSTGQHHDAWETLTRAFDYYEGAGEVAMAVAVAEYPLLFVAGLARATNMVERALSLVDPDSHEAGRLLSRNGLLVNLETGNYDLAREFFDRALAIAERENDRILEMRTLAASADADWYQIHEEDTLAKSLRAIELAQLANDPHAEAWPRFLAAFVSIVKGHPSAAMSHAGEMLSLAESLRDQGLLAMACCANVAVSLHKGDWISVREFADRGLAVDPRLSWILGMRVVAEIQVGDTDEVEVYMQRLIDVMRTTPPGPSVEYQSPAWVIPVATLVTGDDSRFDVAEHAAQAVLSSPSCTPKLALLRFGQALISVHRNDATSAEINYTDLLAFREGMPEGEPLLVVGPCVSRVLGLLAHTMGEPDQAVEHFEDALSFCLPAGYRPELAWACCDYADALRGRDGEGDRAKAMSLLDESLAISSELGMRPLMERVLSRREILKA